MTHFNKEELLQNLGLFGREKEIYLSLLERGPLLPQGVARETGLKRTTLYTIFPKMIKDGFLVEITQGKRRLLQAVSPDKLFDRYEKHYKELKVGIGELLVLYRMQGLKPKVEIHEGLEGVKRVYLDILAEGKDVLVYNRIAKYDKEVLDWMIKDFVPKRIKAGIKVRAIVTREKEGLQHMAGGKEYLRVTRFVPYEKFPLRIETMIYGNKICFLTNEEKGPLVGVIIESKQISEAQKALFELAWEGAEKYQK